VRRTYSLIFASELDAPAARVWDAVGTMKGVNVELKPWLSMTAPPEASGIRIEDAPVGRPLFKSWVLFGGIVPIDRHHFQLAEVERGRRFVESSTSFSQASWEHRRCVEPSEDACILTDRLTFTPRFAPSGALLERVIRSIFRHRHRVLQRQFGGCFA